MIFRAGTQTFARFLYLQRRKNYEPTPNAATIADTRGMVENAVHTSDQVQENLRGPNTPFELDVTSVLFERTLRHL